MRFIELQGYNPKKSLCFSQKKMTFARYLIKKRRINHLNKTTMNKKLERDAQNKVIGGVCAGLANYFDMDVALVRVIFALALLGFGAGFWLYVILWIVLPAGNGVTIETTLDENGNYVMSEPSAEQKKNKGSLTAGLILIGIGALGLINQYIPEINWQTAWPILLIVLGLLLIIPFKSKKP